MRITLVVPGLLWPKQALRDTVCDLSLPALELLLGRARQRQVSNGGVDAFWRALFQAADLPAAPLRRLGLGRDADGTWLCADPVHLHLSPQGALLSDPAELGLAADEMRALAETLAPLLAPFGVLAWAEDEAWHLRLTTPLPELPAQLPLGAGAATLMPVGEGGRPWRRMLNEVQMALHAHPVNAARENRGQPPVNSLALWGGGTLPPVAAPGWDRLYSNDPALRGLARHGGLGDGPLAANLETTLSANGTAENLCLHWTGLAAPRRLQDALAWREGLQALDRDWIAPALARGVDALELVGCDDDHTQTLRYARADRWKFWRGPKPLTELVP